VLVGFEGGVFLYQQAYHAADKECSQFYVGHTNIAVLRKTFSHYIILNNMKIKQGRNSCPFHSSRLIDLPLGVRHETIPLPLL
jgi:hypothetical protein